MSIQSVTTKGASYTPAVKKAVGNLANPAKGAKDPDKDGDNEATESAAAAKKEAGGSVNVKA